MSVKSKIKKNPLWRGVHCQTQQLNLVFTIFSYQQMKIQSVFCAVLVGQVDLLPSECRKLLPSPTAVGPGDWYKAIDLTDTSFQVAIDPDRKQLLICAYAFNSIILQIPGAAAWWSYLFAPYIFTKIALIPHWERSTLAFLHDRTHSSFSKYAFPC